MVTHQRDAAKDLLGVISEKDDLSDSYINKSLQRDYYLMMAVEMGNKEMVEEIDEMLPSNDVNQHYYGNPVLKGDTLRERKNGLIIRNTLCRIGAARAGVPPRYLHNISGKYILLVEKQTSPEMLVNVISPMMFDEYIDLVNHLSVAGYSNLIKKVVVYISENIQEPLSLSNIAEHFHVNPSHLSREFKKETNYTLMNYINRQKIDLAKLLLMQEDYTIMAISAMMSYNSSSYFSKVFKKHTGVSPKEFKDEVLK